MSGNFDYPPPGGGGLGPDGPGGPYGLGAYHTEPTLGPPYPLTNFDKLGMSICVFGAVVLLVLNALVVGDAAATYTSALEDKLPGLSQIVFSKGYAYAAGMLMIFLGYFGTRQRRAYDNNAASQYILLGIALAIAANGLLVYGLFAPATSAMGSF